MKWKKIRRVSVFYESHSQNPKRWMSFQKMKKKKFVSSSPTHSLTHRHWYWRAYEVISIFASTKDYYAESLCSWVQCMHVLSMARDANWSIQCFCVLLKYASFVVVINLVPTFNYYYCTNDKHTQTILSSSITPTKSICWWMERVKEIK